MSNSCLSLANKLIIFKRVDLLELSRIKSVEGGGGQNCLAAKHTVITILSIHTLQQVKGTNLNFRTIMEYSSFRDNAS